MLRTPSKENSLKRRRRLRTTLILLLLVTTSASWAEGLFTAEERTRLVTFWNAPGRCRVGLPPDAAQRGPWQVRLTPDGSAWLLKYQIAAGSAAAPPTQEATAAVAPTDAWKSWVRAKIDYDRWQAQQTADAANAALKPSAGPAKPSDPTKPADTTKPGVGTASAASVPPAPGPIPTDLLAAAGNPPPLASAVAPLTTTVTFDDGKHSLCEVLQREKTEHADDFARDFHAFGMDVSADGVLTVVDPATGAELAGAEAVRKTVDDKRLTAIFQRAGRHSMAFRAAQIEVAKAHYWPTDDAFTITVDGRTVTGKVSDVITSEAGIATLFDRKVNRGSVAPFAEVLTKVMTAHGLTQLKDAVPYEKEIVAALKYRTDYLQDPTLSQPH